MKIALAQFLMYTNIMYNFQSSTCKTVGEKPRTKFCPRTDMAIPVNPLHFVVGGIHIVLPLMRNHNNIWKPKDNIL